jgi:hypothetical protein
MSGINGDKSRFHRQRKQKIARRERKRQFLKTVGALRNPNVPAPAMKAKVTPV